MFNVTEVVSIINSRHQNTIYNRKKKVILKLKLILLQRYVNKIQFKMIAKIAQIIHCRKVIKIIYKFNFFFLFWNVSL